MKTIFLKNMAAALAVTGLVVGSVSTAVAQNSPTPTAVPPAASTVAPQLAYGVSQILQLKQAEVSDSTIIAYIKNSGNSYGLNADQIIYLRQQGLSDAVITAMLQQPSQAVAAASAPVAMPTTPAPTPEASTATVAPSATYVQTVPDPNYYSEPYAYYTDPYYYPGYAWYPPVSLSFGWGWGGGGWHGGGSAGGWHGGPSGGGWHGDGHGGNGGRSGGSPGGWHH